MTARSRTVRFAFAGSNLVVLAIALVIGLTSFARAHAACTIDVQGADDEPNQKDASQFCHNGTCGGTSVSLGVGLDDRSFPGANTGDACMLFDTDGDGNANRAICGTLEGAGTLKAGSPTCYTCGDTRPDRCTSSAAVACTTTCSATATADPFAADLTHDNTNDCNGTNCLTFDSTISCCVTEADRGGAGGILIDACSYPSQQPNADPSDCVVTRECNQNDPPSVCDDANPCTDDTCDDQAGVCNHVAGGGGETCRTGAGVCDVAETCTGTDIACPPDGYAQSGVCRAASDACDAAESCDGSGVNCPADGVLPGGVCRVSSGQCDVAESCDGISKACPTDGFQPNDTPCTDGDVCTSGEVCIGGQCSSGSPTVCSDGNACTTDFCDPQTGCATTPVVCDDGSACTLDSCDPQSGCTTTPMTCDDGDACTHDVCDPQTGCGTTPVVCDDADPCTTDTCDPEAGCASTPMVCADDGLCCNGSELCVAGQCVSSGNPCPGVCTGGAICQCGCMSDGECDDGNACTADVCDAQAGTCTNTPIVCDDGNACTGDVCDPQTGCGTTPVVCDDGNACTTDSCDPGTGCATTPVVCDDGNACTTDVCDPQTGCGTTPVVCDDGSACTTDSCDPQTGCETVPVVCDDGNACTDDVCDRQTGCGATPVVCDDGDACTTDSCDPQTGCGTAPVACDDANLCTTDTCNPQSGLCEFTANDEPCEDGLFCTGPDFCFDKACQGGPVDPCNDHLACTNDACVEPVPDGEPGHCEHAPVAEPCCDTDAECADEDGCTIDEACVNNACVSEQIDCAEPVDDPCTIDSCTSLSASDFKCENTDCNELGACPTSHPECVPLTCGNTVVEPSVGETCDPPGSTTTPNGNPCRTNCTYCGDGIKNGDEACDDGNTVTGCDPIHPQQAADDCQNDCTVALCKDPAKITLAEWLDRYDVHGRLPSSTLVDFGSRPLVVELTDARGRVVYRTSLRAGSLVGDVARGKFKYGNKGARAWGGLAKVKISRHRGGYRLTATTYGNLFASGADMVTNVYSGGTRWTVHGAWKATRRGWKFVE